MSDSLVETLSTIVSETPTITEHGFFSSRVFQKRAIKNSKFISDPQKHQLLDAKRHATNFVQPNECSHAMMRFIQKHRKTRKFPRGEGNEPFFRADTKVITGLVLGRPIIKSFSLMLSEYYKGRYGVDLEVVEVLRSNKGITAGPDHTQSAEWFHVNFKAKPKDDDGGDNEKVYFAEVVVFMFGYSPSLCCVNACLPVDDDVSFGNSCRCLFRSCFVKHPSITAYNDDRLLIKPTSYPIWFEAKEIFHLLIRTRSRCFGKQCVWLDTNRKRPVTPFYLREEDIDPIPCDRDRTEASMKEAPTKYLYKSCKMSEDILMPKKRQGTNPEELQKFAVVMAKRIKNWRKPR